jgi:hypothetical protein
LTVLRPATPKSRRRQQHNELLGEFLGVRYLGREGQIEEQVVDPVAVFGDDFLDNFAW